VNPSGASDLDAWFARELRGAGGPDAEVEVVHLALAGPGRGPFLPAPASYASPLLDAVAAAQRDGCDAVAIGCSGDPCLVEARRTVGIPVAGPLDAALHVAAQHGGRLAILVAEGFEAPALYREQARTYGLEHLIGEIAVIDMHYEDDTDDADPFAVLERHRAVLAGEALEAARAAVDRGARAVYAGCTFWTGTMLDPLREQLGVPVIDPGRGAVALAAAAVRAAAPVPATAGATA
jgi:allantoin racemase